MNKLVQSVLQPLSSLAEGIQEYFATVLSYLFHQQPGFMLLLCNCSSVLPYFMESPLKVYNTSVER